MKNTFVKFMVVATVAAASMVGITAPAYAANPNCDPKSMSLSSGVNCAKSGEQQENLFGNGGIFNTIVNVLLFLIGAISVVMLVYGGIQYTLSSGDSGKVNNAKNTILYAIVGLVVALLAYAIVNFVVGNLVGGNTNTGGSSTTRTN